MPTRRKFMTGVLRKTVNWTHNIARQRPRFFIEKNMLKYFLSFHSSIRMLEFWFNPQLSFLQKLLFFIVIAVVTALLYWMQPLPLNAILMFVGTGIIFLICRYCKIHFASKKPTGLLYRV